MSTAERFIPNYSIRDYQRWQGDWELIDGVAIAMTPSPFGRHERIVARIVHLLLSSIESQACDCQVYAGLDWIVHEHTIVRPDVMVVCGEQPDEHLQRPPVLVVEVMSPSTQITDRTTKFEIYETNGVSFYVLIDPDTSHLACWERIGNRFERRPPTDELTLQLPSGCRLVLPKSRWVDPEKS